MIEIIAPATSPQHFKLLTDTLCRTFELVPHEDRDKSWYANSLDCFMYQYIRHTCVVYPSQEKRRRFLGPLRDLVTEPYFDKSHIWTLIAAMEEYLLSHELYEYLARNKENKTMVEKTIKKAQRKH